MDRNQIFLRKTYNGKLHNGKLHIPPTSYHLLDAQLQPHKRAYLLTKNFREQSGKSQENRLLPEISQDGKSTWTRQENEKGSSS